MDEPRFTLHTEHPLAAQSSGTIHPHGSRIVNSRCVRWNQKVFAELLGGYERVLKVLDLGCWAAVGCAIVGSRAILRAGIDGSNW